MHWQQQLKSWLVPQVDVGDRRSSQVDSGMYHYQRARDDGYMRFHLRVERNGESLLIAGASEAVRLSSDGTYVIKTLLDGGDPKAQAETLGHFAWGRWSSTLR